MQDLRSHFPTLVHQPELSYLDSAATTLKPIEVIERVSTFMSDEYGSVHRGLYPLAVSATRAFENARSTIRQFISAPEGSQIIITHGATESLNIIAHHIALQYTRGTAFFAASEHHANFLPWQQLPNLTKQLIPLNQAGEPEYSWLLEQVDRDTHIVALSHTSNVTGHILPSWVIPALRERTNALIVLDTTQSLSRQDISALELNADVLVGSSHKMYGPSGSGFLWVSAQLAATLHPLLWGGEMVTDVSTTGYTLNQLPWRFEAGTPALESTIGFAAALSFMQTHGVEAIEEHTAATHTWLAQSLRATEGVWIIGNPEPESGILSFTVTDIHPHDLAEFMGEQGVCIRAGHHCAAPLHHHLGITGSNRASIGIYTSQSDLDRFMQTLTQAMTTLR